MAIESTSYPARSAAIARLPAIFGRLVVDGLRAHRAFLIVIALFVAACIAIGRITGNSEVVWIRLHTEVFAILIALFALTGFIGHTLWVMFVRPPKGSLFTALGRIYRDKLLEPRQLVGFFLAAAPIPLFMSAFSSFKRMIPFNNPYTWDPAFMEWDRILHGGLHPWEILQPLLGYPLVTSAINIVYNGWLFVLFLTLLWQCWSRRDPMLRKQFLLSYLFCWIVLGSLFATIFASGGPVYYGRLTGLEDPFAPLMTYLYQAEDEYTVWSLAVQETLWESYLVPGTEIGRGISAMPSLHIATVTLFALLGWRVNRVVGAAYTAFAFIIFLGSIHLGWHYAIDGYASAIAMIAIWKAVGWTLRRQAAPQRANQFPGLTTR